MWTLYRKAWIHRSELALISALIKLLFQQNSAPISVNHEGEPGHLQVLQILS